LITSTYRPYPEYEKHKSIDKTRSRFVSAFTHLFFEMLNFGDELRTLEKIGKNTGYSASETFKDSVRQSIRIESNSLGEQDKHQFRVKINARKLGDLLANYLDGTVIAQSRRRTPNNAPKLFFVGELLNLGHDIEISFHFNRAENKVGFLKSHRPQRTKETWLETVLIRAINAMDNSIVFADLEGDHDR
jgi:hypothetical protein